MFQPYQRCPFKEMELCSCWSHPTLGNTGYGIEFVCPSWTTELSEKSQNYWIKCRQYLGSPWIYNVFVRGGETESHQSLSNQIQLILQLGVGLQSALSTTGSFHTHHGANCGGLTLCVCWRELRTCLFHPRQIPTITIKQAYNWLVTRSGIQRKVLQNNVKTDKIKSG